MKKIWLIVTVLMLITTSAFGEGLDFSTMSLDELQELHEKLDAEIKSRIDCTTPTSYNGLLIGGKSINPGGYQFTRVDADVTIYVWSTEDDYYNGGGYNRYKIDDSTLLFFNEGTTALIDGGTVTIQPASEDWIPQQTD